MEHVFLIMALCFMLYYIVLCVYIKKIHPTFSFYWLVLATFCVISATIWHKIVMNDTYRNFGRCFGIVLCTIWAIYGAFMIPGCIYIIVHVKCQNKPINAFCDYLIVLGAKTNHGKPSKSLQSRLNAAILYAKYHPETKLILSGGKGTDEIEQEAVSMQKNLLFNGISAERILLEKNAKNTCDNLQYSKDIICRQEESFSSLRIGIVTNDYHMYRTLLMAKSQGFENVVGIAAKSSLISLPNNVTRELFSLIYNTIKGNMR